MRKIDQDLSLRQNAVLLKYLTPFSIEYFIRYKHIVLNFITSF